MENKKNILSFFLKTHPFKNVVTKGVSPCDDFFGRYSIVPIGDSSEFVEVILSSLAEELPPIFARKDIPRFLGSSLAVGTLANLGASKGPPYIRRGRHAVYERVSFLSWYRTWLLKKI